MIHSLIEYILLDTSGLIVQLFFTFTIILMVRDKQKPPVLTAVMTGLALIVFGIGDSFISSLVAAISILNGILWLFIGWQRHDQSADSS